MNAVSVGAVGDFDSDEEVGMVGGGVSASGGTRRARDESKALGSRNSRRVAGAGCITAKREAEDAELVEYVGEMSKAVTAMAHGLSSEHKADNLEQLVRAQIKEEIKDTNATLARTKKCVEELRDLLAQALAKDSMK